MTFSTTVVLNVVYDFELSKQNIQQCRQCTYNVKLRRFHIDLFAVEKQ